MICVVAEKYIDAKEFAASHNTPICELRFIDSFEKLKGFRSIELHVLKSAHKRKDIDAILLEAFTRDIKVVHHEN
jgi:hypothetical protein